MAGPTLPDIDDIMSKIRKMNGEMNSPYNDGYVSWGIKQDLYILKFFLDKVVADALTQVGMIDFIDRPPHHLSFGQRRRVAVATVLAMRPEILVLDEPSSNLDPASRRELADILRSLDITIVMVTHDLPYAFELCERSVILSGGIIVADDKTGQILNDEKLLKSHRLELPVGFSFN